MSRRWIIVCCMALGSGFLAGKLVFRPGELPVNAGEGRVAPESAKSPLKMPFLEDGFGRKALSLLNELKRSMHSGGDILTLMDSLAKLDAAERNSVLLELIADLNASELEMLYRVLDRDGDALDDAGVAIALFDRLVRLDADRFFSLAAEDDGSWNFLPMIGVAFLAAADPDAALERLKTLGDDSLSGAFAMGLAIHSTEEGLAWLREHGGENPDYDQVLVPLLRDPALAFEEVLLIEDESERESTMRGLLRKWARKDGHAALAAVERLAEGETRDGLVESVIRTWAKSDPLAALEQARMKGMEVEALGSWIATDAEAAYQWASQHLDATRRASFVRELHPFLPMEQVIPFFQELSEAERRDVFATEGFMDRLVGHDAGLAMEMAGKMTGENLPEGFSAAHLGGQMAKRDLAEAMDAVGALPSESVQRGFVMGVAIEGIRTDPQATLEWIDRLAFPDIAEVETRLFSEWGRIDPESAIEAARGRGEGGNELVAGVVKEWTAFADAEYVFEWVREDMKQSGEIQEQMAETWLDRDPQAGAELLMANNVDGEMTSALAVLMEKWAAADPEGAARFIGR